MTDAGAPAVAVVTDSTAMLPADVREVSRIRVVPLQVVIGAQSYEDGVDPEAAPAAVAEALRTYTPVSTSRPSPAAFLAEYEAAKAAGAEAVVSVHLSAEVSATHESAMLAAREAPLPVRVVDSRQIGAGTGYAALAAARVAAGGDTVEAAATAARRCSAQTTALFYVDTLEYLRRGGRMGAAAALVGSALAVKPILTIGEGRVVPKEKVRTASRALARLEDLVTEAAGEREVDLTVCHLANADAAAGLATRLRDRLAANLGEREVSVAEVPAVLGAHVGPGLVGVVLAPTLGALHS